MEVLLKLCEGRMPKGEFRTWEEIQAEIERVGGRGVVAFIRKPCDDFCYPATTRECNYCCHDNEDALNSRFKPRYRGCAMEMQIQRVVDRIKKI